MYKLIRLELVYFWYLKKKKCVDFLVYCNIFNKLI